MSVNRKERRRSQRQDTSGAGHFGSAARSRWVVAAVFLAGIAATGLYVALRPADVPRIDHTDLAQVERGRQIYQAECASCHGTNLEGQPNWRRRLAGGKMPAPPHDASGHTWHHPDRVLFDITKKGPAAYPSVHQIDMPAFSGKLNDQDIAAVLSFIKSNWPSDILRRQPKGTN